MLIYGWLAIVLADRGQGILKTLKRVKSELKNHEEALRVAFTEFISGRMPEARGNGLKFVREVIEKNPLGLLFQNGSAELSIGKNDSQIKIKIKQKDNFYRGCIAIINY